MLSLRLPENRNGSCTTVPIWFTNEARFTSRTSYPSTRMLPLVTSYSLRIREERVVLPAPVAPTTAMVSPGFMVRLMPFRTSTSGL